MNSEFENEYLNSGNVKNYLNALELKRGNMPRYLYRYRTFKIERIKHEISGYIYLSNIKYFNDPYDTRSILSNGKFLLLNKLKDKYIEIATKRFNESEKNEIFSKEKWFDEMLVKGLVKENVSENDAKTLNNIINLAIKDLCNTFNNFFNKKLIEQIRIACFTLRWYNLPMWCHYADKFSGYCIEYDTTKIKSILCKNRMFAVKYVDKYRNILEDIANVKDLEKEMMHIIDEYATTKLKDWEYENEWRLILNLGMIYSSEKEASKIFNEKGIEIAFAKPSRIIIGARMREENIKIIENECKKNNIKMVWTVLSDSGIILKT